MEAGADRSGQWIAAERFLVDGLRDLRLEAVPVGEDVQFEDPLSGHIVSGVAAVTEYLRAHQSWLRDVYVDESVEEQDRIAIRGRLERLDGSMVPYTAWFAFRQQQIAGVRMYWDPRPILR